MYYDGFRVYNSRRVLPYNNKTQKQKQNKTQQGENGSEAKGRGEGEGGGEAATEEQARGREEAEEFGRFEHFDKGLISRSQEKQRRSLEERR